MRNHILYLLLVLFVTTTVNAQTDYFAPVGAEWCYGSKGTFFHPFYAKYHAEKDTIIMGQNCRKISAVSTTPGGNNEVWPPTFVYATADTVFCYNDSFRRFVPMYIFNVTEGDTLTYYVSFKFEGIPGSSWSDSLFQVTVTKVDSLYINGIYLRQVWTRPVENWGFIDSYIERIGSTYAMSGNIFLGSFPETYDRALRSYQDASISYKHNEYDCTFLPTAINEKTKWKEIHPYPNPGNGLFSIDIGITNIEDVEIKLTDISGRQLVPMVSASDHILNIDVKAFPTGIYLLNMKYDKSQYHFKLIKI